MILLTKYLLTYISKWIRIKISRKREREKRERGIITVSSRFIISPY